MDEPNQVIATKNGHYFVFRFRTIDEFSNQLLDFVLNPDINFNSFDANSVAYDLVYGLMQKG
jgi:hypothetical protein